MDNISCCPVLLVLLAEMSEWKWVVKIAIFIFLFVNNFNFYFLSS